MCPLSLFLHTLLLISLSIPCPTYSWGLFSSPSAETHSNDDHSVTGNFVAEFSMEPISNQKGLELVENANQKLMSPNTNSCWRNAYGNLFGKCSEIVADEKEKKSRLAWHLSDCFQKDSGRSAFPSCHTSSPMVKCLKKLDDSAHKVYLEFYIQTNSICHQLQADAFKHQTERLVNNLKKSALFAEEKLEHMQEKSEQLLENSNQIHNSLSSIDIRVEQVAQTSKGVEEHIDVVLKYSKDIFKQSKDIAASQSELQGAQMQMREKLEEGISMLEESYENLGQDVEKIRNEAIEIEREINQVSDSMSLKMNNLQNKADDIGNIAGLSLDKQKKLLDGQSTALESLDFLTKFQSQALEESRDTLQRLAEFGQKQQEELLGRQEELKRAHDHLVENSRSILAAQEAFEMKQANMFMALDKLFNLHNSILRESRSIKTFIFYSIITAMLYMFTSAKQTYNVRARLYIGLCATFLLEFVIVRFGDELDQQTWIASKTTLLRSSFMVIACIQIVLSIFTFRDYEVLNHKMLQTLMEKVNTMEKHKYLYLASVQEESDVNFSSWIDTDLTDDEDYVRYDPDFRLQEEVAESSVPTSSVTRKYDLRPRPC